MTNKLKIQEDKEIPKIELSDDENDINEYLDNRETELKENRKDVFGQNIDNLMAQADIDCQVRDELGGTASGSGKAVLVENETLGWRGTSQFAKLGVEDWQSNNASNDPYVKLMVALSILFENDPKAVLSPDGLKYKATTEIQKQLYEKSWKTQYSREQLKAFIFDLGKYGWAVGRTFLKQKVRTISEITEYNPETRESKEEEKEIKSFTEPIRKRLNPHRVWFDDMAKANDPESIGDWMWEEDYNWDKLESEFGDCANFKFVQINGSVIEEENKPEESKKKLTTKDIYTVQFYETYWKDRFIARIKSEGYWIILVNTPLPADHKELSCWTTFWNMRHPDTPYGVAPIEIMRGNKKLKNKIKNMTIDQIVLSIYKMGFIEDKKAFGSQEKIKIVPGLIRKVIGKISWLEVPGPGQDAKFGMDLLQKDIDNDTGITPTLEGEISGKTAFEIGQAKESALKRLKLPLDNIGFALEVEALKTIDLTYQSYTIPMVEHLVDEAEIKAYREEIKDNTKFYFIDEKGSFYAKRYKEFSLNVKKDESGMFVPSDKEKFFRMTPEFIRWRGDITIKAQSLLATWKEVEKSNVLQLGSKVIEFLQLGPELAKKPLTELLKAWDENEKDWLPETWLNEKPSKESEMAKFGEQVYGKDKLPQDLKSQIPETSTTEVPEEETQIL